MGYEIYLNDLFSKSDEILDRFELSDIPLTDTFGSSSDPPVKPPKFVLLVGPAVEIDRLNELLDLIYGIGPDYIQVEIDNSYRKKIYIGCNQFDDKLIKLLTYDLIKTLKNSHFTPTELTSYLRRDEDEK